MRSETNQNRIASEKLTSPLALGALLGLLVLILYWPAASFEFSHFDDEVYYVYNDEVQAGLNGDGLVWAFTTGATGNWHPLTWMSLMLDAELGTGPTDAGTPHFTNILLHALDAALLLVLLNRATKAKWRSVLAAGLFAFHPLNVESVAWVAERKTVLCMLFLLASALAYVRYAEERRSQRDIPADATAKRTGSGKFLALSLGLFALSLMSKPMAVTMPFLLLLMDFWPLRRVPMGRDLLSRWAPLITEKWAYVLLSLASCIVTFIVQKNGNAVQSSAHFPLVGRIANALVSYEVYLSKTAWPTNLAVYYPHPGNWPLSITAGAALLILLASMLAIFYRNGFPYIFVGWFWFLGAMVPMIGLVQVGTQAMADRYAYLPLIGIFIAAVWGGFSILERFKIPPKACFAGGLVILLTAAVAARHQLNYWKNDGVLFAHALAVTKDNPVSESTLGVYFGRNQSPDEAINHYRAALAIDPEYKIAHFDLAVVLERTGQTDAALQEYRAAIQEDPAYLEPSYNLALLLEHLDRREEAIAQFKRVLQIKPGFLPAEQHLQELGANR